VSSVEQRLERLESIDEITRLQAAYAAALDDGFDADRLVALFTEDGSFDATANGGVRTTGRDALHAMWSSPGRFRWALHYMMAPNIELADDGNSAQGTWYLLEPAVIADADDVEKSYLTGSTYDIEYKRDSGQWRFAEMRIIGRMMSDHAAGWQTP
jgi:hypothetical protein